MPKYHVLGFNRILDRVALIASNLTAAQAEKECDEWGWTYNDGIELRSYTMTIIPADKYDLQDILSKPYSKGLSFIIEDDSRLVLQLIALKTDFMIRNAYDLGIISKEDYSKYIRNSIETEMEFANGPGSK